LEKCEGWNAGLNQTPTNGIDPFESIMGIRFQRITAITTEPFEVNNDTSEGSHTGDGNDVERTLYTNWNPQTLMLHQRTHCINKKSVGEDFSTLEDWSCPGGGN
jgi:hypothetical protein